MLLYSVVDAGDFGIVDPALFSEFHKFKDSAVEKGLNKLKMNPLLKLYFETFPSLICGVVQNYGYKYLYLTMRQADNLIRWIVQQRAQFTKGIDLILIMFSVGHVLHFDILLTMSYRLL